MIAGTHYLAAESAEDFARAVRLLWELPALRVVLASHGRRLAEACAWRRSAGSLDEFYRATLAARGSGGRHAQERTQA
jgi:hypothetical protein